MKKIAFVTNFCPHYRIKTYEILSKKHDIDFYFYSSGNEWYWQKKHGTNLGNFKANYLRSFMVLNNHITPSLFIKLLFNHYDFYFKCINGKFPLLITFLVAKIKHKPFILWTGVWANIDKPVQRFFFPITKVIYKNSDAIVTYGTHVTKYLTDLGIDSRKIFSSKHAIDNEFYLQSISKEKIINYCKEKNIQDNKKNILFIGRLEEIKGLQFLIDAFIQLGKPNYQLIIAGTGSMKDELMQHAKMCESGIITFTDYVSLDETLILYSISDLFVLPSIQVKSGKETWGLVVNEAFTKGVPVIATEAVGAAAGGLLENNINGIIVPEKDSNAIKNAILKILENKTLRESMKKNAINKMHTWNNEAMVQAFYNAIDFVTEKQ